MNKHIAFFFVCIFLSSFIACGDDESNNPIANDVESSSSEIQDDDDKSSDSKSVKSSSSEKAAIKSSDSQKKESNSSSSETKKSSDAKSGTESSSSSAKSSSSSSDKNASSSSSEIKTYAASKVKPSGTYDCKKYKCFTTEYLNQKMLAAGDYGEILDERDNQVYKTVIIDDQVWMAQNLNYETAYSYCTDDDCAKYGRYYLWSAAVDRKGCEHGNFCSLPPSVQGVCPAGWHLPSKDEYLRLFDNVGKYGGTNNEFVAAELRAQRGWSVEDNADDYGFSALPTGYKLGSAGDFADVGKTTHAWTSTEVNSIGAYQFRIYEDRLYVSLIDDSKGYPLPVRCVMDKDSLPKIQAPALYLEHVDEWLGVVSREEYLNPNVIYDSLVDPRDGLVYKTKKIGKQVWMAQNLNYADSTKTPSLANGSWCYNDEPEYCKLLGRLYNWTAAKDVCPDGWHLPSYDEWKVLESKFGGQIMAGQYLKAQAGSLSNNGDDEFGFSALPAGGRFIDDSEHDKVNYLYLGDNAFFWSSTPENDDYAYRMNIPYSSNTTNIRSIKKKYGHYVRCVRD